MDESPMARAQLIALILGGAAVAVACVTDGDAVFKDEIVDRPPAAAPTWGSIIGRRRRAEQRWVGGGLELECGGGSAARSASEPSGGGRRR